MKSSPSNGSILFVNPGGTAADAARAPLKRDGHEMSDVGEGIDPVDLAAELRPDLLLLEVTGMEDGSLDLCRRLRSDPDTRDLPVLAVAYPGLGGPSLRLQALDAGALDFLCTDGFGRELGLRVRNLIRQRRYGRELRAAIRRNHEQDRWREAWAVSASRELDQALREFASSDSQESRALEHAQELTAVIAACGARERSTLSAERCDLSELVDGMRGDLPVELEDAELEGWVEADAALLRRVLRHLIVFGAELAAEETPTVTLRGLEPDLGTGGVELSVAGSGIAHRALGQLKNTGGRVGCHGGASGSDLVLAFCRHAIQLMKGSLGAEAIPGEGWRFWITLPREEMILPSNVIPMPGVSASWGQRREVFPGTTAGR